MSDPSVINLVGRPYAGKSTQGDYLERLGYTLWRPSEAIRDFALNNNIPINCREDYIPVRRVMTDKDPDAFTRPVVELLALGVDRICVDGMRVVSNVDNYAKHAA